MDTAPLGERRIGYLIRELACWLVTHPFRVRAVLSAEFLMRRFNSQGAEEATETWVYGVYPSELSSMRFYIQGRIMIR